MIERRTRCDGEERPLLGVGSLIEPLRGRCRRVSELRAHTTALERGDESAGGWHDALSARHRPTLRIEVTPEAREHHLGVMKRNDVWTYVDTRGGHRAHRAPSARL